MTDAEFQALLAKAQEQGNILNLAITLLVKRSQLDDSERISIAEVHESWRQKTYGANEYVRYGTTPAGRAQLWMSTKAITTANAPAPGETGASWKKL